MITKAQRDKLGRMRQATDRLDRLLCQLGRQGLQRVTEASATELQAMAQLAHNAGLIKAERELESLRTAVGRYLARDPVFSTASWTSRLNRLWLLNRATRSALKTAEQPADVVHLTGEARRRYQLLTEPLTVQPLGAEGWVSDSGFMGITVYLRALKHGELFSATNARPTDWFGEDPRRLMGMPMSDHQPFTIHELCHGGFELFGAKVSADRRLSLHRDLDLRPAPNLGSRAYDDIAASEWVELVDRLATEARRPIDRGTSVLAFLRPSAMGELVIDDKFARARMPLVDRRGAEVFIEVPLRVEKGPVVDNLQLIAAGSPPVGWFGRVTQRGSELVFAPMTAMWETQVAISWRRRVRHVQELHLSLETLEKR